MSLFTTAFRVTQRRLKTRPLRALLILLQVLLGALAMTLALSAYLGARHPGNDAERFNLVAGSEGEDTAITYTLFNQAGLSEMLKLAPDVRMAALYDEVDAPEVVVGETRYQFRQGARVSPSYFTITETEAARGSLFTSQELETGGTVALISEEAARTLFGEADPVGQTVALLTNFTPPGDAPALPTPYRIVGTFIEPQGQRSDTQPTIYFPFVSPDAPGQSLDASTVSILAAPRRGAAAREEIRSAARQVYAQRLAEEGITEGSDLLVKELGEEVGGSGASSADLIIFSLFGVVAFAVASIGIFSVTVVETLERAHETGLRRALGASRGRIGLETMAETGLLAFFGGLLGIALAALVIPLLSAQTDLLFGGEGFSFKPLAALIVLVVVTVVAAGLGWLPTLQTGRLQPIQVLKEA